MRATFYQVYGWNPDGAAPLIYDSQSTPVFLSDDAHPSGYYGDIIPAHDETDCSGEFGCTTYTVPASRPYLGASVQTDLKYKAPWAWIGLDGMYGWTGDGQFPGNAFANRAAVEKILAPFGAHALDLADDAAFKMWQYQVSINGKYTPAESNAAAVIQGVVTGALSNPEYATSPKAKAILAYFSTPAWQAIAQQSAEAAYKLGKAHASANETMSVLEQLVDAFSHFMIVAGPLMAAGALIAAGAAEAATAAAAEGASSATGESAVFDFDFGDIGDFSVDIGDLDFTSGFDTFELPANFSDIPLEIPDVPIDIPGETFDFTSFTDLPGEAFDFSQYADITNSWLPEFSTPDLSFQDFLKYGNKALDVYKQYSAIQQRAAATGTTTRPPVTSTGQQYAPQSAVPQYPVSLAPTFIKQPPPGYAYDSVQNRYVPLPAEDLAMMQNASLLPDSSGLLQDSGNSSKVILWGGLGILALLLLSGKDARV